MRKSTLRIIGGICIFLAALGLGGITIGGLFAPGFSYNAFLLTFGLLAFAAADLGGMFGRWFDFMFGIILAILCLTSAGAWLRGATDVHVGTIFFNGIAAIFVLYMGHELPHQLEEAEHKQS